MKKQKYGFAPGSKWMTSEEIDKEIEIKKLMKQPEYRNAYILGMLTGLKDGNRTVEDVYDHLIKLFDGEL